MSATASGTPGRDAGGRADQVVEDRVWLVAVAINVSAAEISRTILYLADSPERVQPDKLVHAKLGYTTRD